MPEYHCPNIKGTTGENHTLTDHQISTFIMLKCSRQSISYICAKYYSHEKAEQGSRYLTSRASFILPSTRQLLVLTPWYHVESLFRWVNKQFSEIEFCDT